ncbi:MAG: hypothetical protein IKP92_09145 [Lachnospiraceae bacterium]|nr:hypothetical protein [Lachnospiraceae bacterium]
MVKKIAYIGIASCILYFISVGAFLITHTEIALTIWESMTIFGAIVEAVVLIQVSTFLKTPDALKKAMLVFLSCVCALTGAAHIINITVTRKLMAEGVEVPSYFQIGQWPSAEMAVDYLAWGLFMGLALLCIGMPILENDKRRKAMKIVALISGILCISGFCGAVMINENIWYIAILGYGIGIPVLCFQMSQRTKSK